MLNQRRGFNRMRWVGGLLMAVSMAGAAGASTVTFDWITPTGLSTAGASPITGTLVLTGTLPSITSSTFSGTLTGAVQSFSLAENGLTVSTSPTGTSWSVTNGILSPFTDGSITSTLSANALANRYSFTGTATTASVLSLASLTANSVVGSLLNPYLKGSNELAFFGSGTASLGGTIAPLTTNLSATGTGAGYLGYWQIQAVPVPLPGALGLLASAAAALLLVTGLRRRAAPTDGLLYRSSTATRWLMPQSNS